MVLSCTRKLHEGYRNSLFNPNNDSIGPDSANGRVLYPVDGKQAPAAFGNGAQVDTAAEVPLKNVCDLLFGGMGCSDDLEVLALYAGFGRADECKSFVVDDELFEGDSSPDCANKQYDPKTPYRDGGQRGDDAVSDSDARTGC